MSKGVKAVPTISERVEAESGWFHRMDLGNGVVTPGWSDPVADKLPYFGLPADLSGKRVLDVGCAEGFFSFEAERRGAAEVVAVDYNPACIKRFRICSEALDSTVAPPLHMGVYDLDPMKIGTFDLVMFFGLLYHLKHPVIGVSKVAAVTSGTLLMASYTMEMRGRADVPLAKYNADGIMSGPKESPVHDRTVSWEPNASCMHDLLVHVGMVDIERLDGPKPTIKEDLLRRFGPKKYSIWNSSAQFRAKSGHQSLGEAPR